MKFSTATLTTLAATAVIAAPSADNKFSATYKGYNLDCSAGSCLVACAGGVACGLSKATTVSVGTDLSGDLSTVVSDVQTLLDGVIGVVQGLLDGSS
ncbi:hypothetical protein TRVA0_051S00650 [Trichomonascus vanleenenianus]|uniref:uncharacterized protein n=1 Tax=Trichomonascus vanleenenianus TaxID=2268995 RepID=UPI003ECBA944